MSFEKTLENEDLENQEENVEGEETTEENEEEGEELEEEESEEEEEDSEEEDDDGEPGEPGEKTEESEEGEEEEFEFDGKVKVWDEEHEIPEHLKKAVKNEEQARELKDIYEKALGIEPLKQKRDYFREQATTWETKYKEKDTEINELTQNLDFLDRLIKENDLQTFQQYAEIKDEQVLQRAADIIRYRELTPQQKAEYDKNVQSRQRLYQVEQENQKLSQTYESQEVQQSQAALDAVLGQDDYKPVIAQIESRLGEGAFKREVIQRAAYKEQTTGQSMSPEEAVKEVVNLFGLDQSQITKPQENSEHQQSTPPKKDPENTIVTKKKPTMPKVGGGSKNPARPIVKSLDDIRKLADQMDY